MYYDIHIEYISYSLGKPKLMCEDIKCVSYAEFIDTLFRLDYAPVKIVMNFRPF